MELTVNLHECKHCSGTGTCTNGLDGNSCYACAERNELPFWRRKNQHGLMCGSCGGIGKAEPMTERINKRVAPLLAIYLSVALIAIMFFAAFTESKFFSEILAFSSAIIGAVVGFYFSSRSKGL